MCKSGGPYITLCRVTMEQYLMLPIAICRASPVSSGAQTTDKHNSDSAMDSKAIRYKDPWFGLPWLWKAATLWPTILQCKFSLWFIINADPILRFLHCNVAVGSVAIVLEICCLYVLCKGHKMNTCVPKCFLTSRGQELRALYYIMQGDNGAVSDAAHSNMQGITCQLWCSDHR